MDDNPLVRLRVAKGLSRSTLARRAGVSGQLIVDWESERRTPNSQRLDDVMRALGATSEDARTIRAYYFSSPETRASAVSHARPAEQTVHIGTLRSQINLQSLPTVPQAGRPDPSPIATPVEFAQALNAVHVWAGTPSLRKLQEQSDGMLRRATISDMLNTNKVAETQRIPALDRCIAFLRVCGIRDTDEWVTAWRRLKARQRPQAGGWLQI
ncbi:helix-turn-helix transcriptional regulator [Streptomyces sp. NPDC089922]|uniref:helix-turn-helix transcriptional regulator n=1 Tax=Streptomyces sp. NPDC089922 TaxID=3155189 RepID=UPI003413A009